MAFHIQVSVNESQKRFLTDKGLSPSKLLQESINNLAKETDPELFQKNINAFTRTDVEHKHIIKWQKLNEFYIDNKVMREFAMLLFAYSCGQDISKQVRALGISTNDMFEVQDKLKEIENE